MFHSIHLSLFSSFPFQVFHPSLHLYLSLYIFSNLVLFFSLSLSFLSNIPLILSFVMQSTLFPSELQIPIIPRQFALSCINFSKHAGFSYILATFFFKWALFTWTSWFQFVPPKQGNLQASAMVDEASLEMMHEEEPEGLQMCRACLGSTQKSYQVSGSIYFHILME